MIDDKLCFEREMKSLSPADIKTPKNFNLRGPKKGQSVETHDFAMAILQREIMFTDSVRPICIPRQVGMMDNWVTGETLSLSLNQNAEIGFNID